MAVARLGAWWISLLIVLGMSVSSCTSSVDSPSPSVPTVDLTDSTQVKQVPLDQGFTCTPDGSLQEGATSSCSLPTADPAHPEKPRTVVTLAVGEGFDGLEAYNAAGCPKDSENVGHGWIWAGDGYFIQVFLDGQEPTPAEQAIKAAYGDTVSCAW